MQTLRIPGLGREISVLDHLVSTILFVGAYKSFEAIKTVSRSAVIEELKGRNQRILLSVSRGCSAG